jgi:hypothetical protein
MELNIPTATLFLFGATQLILCVLCGIISVRTKVQQAQINQIYQWNKDKFVKKPAALPDQVAEIRKPKKPQRIISEETRKKSSEKRREWWANKKAQEAAKAAPSAIIIPKGMSLVSQDLNA